MQEYDIFVIGGGSAGLKAARTAALLGKCVGLAEQRELGGECFWAGCVPTKAMVRAAQVWELVRRSHEFGIETEIRRADFADAMGYKQRAINRVAGEGPKDGGLSSLGVDYYPVHARFEDSHELRVGDTAVSARQIILATGTVPRIPAIPGLEETGYITNREAVDLMTLPKRIVILGAGPIGLEFAQVFQRFGAQVTVVEQAERILTREDEEIGKEAECCLREEGITLLLSTVVECVMSVSQGKQLAIRHGDERQCLECDEILVAAGRAAAVDGLQVEAAGLKPDSARVTVNSELRTEIPHIWAAGDLTGAPLFTHVASYTGKIVALNACGMGGGSVDYSAVPRCTYLSPEVASVGLTEREARDQGNEIDVYVYPFAHLDRAILHGETKGLVKLIAQKGRGTLLGAHILGHEASSLLGEVTLCIRHKLPISAIADTMHAYPSFPEAIEATALSSPR